MCEPGGWESHEMEDNVLLDFPSLRGKPVRVQSTDCPFPVPLTMIAVRKLYLNKTEDITCIFWEENISHGGHRAFKHQHVWQSVGNESQDEKMQPLGLSSPSGVHANRCEAFIKSCMFHAQHRWQKPVPCSSEEPCQVFLVLKMYFSEAEKLGANAKAIGLTWVSCIEFPTWRNWCCFVTRSVLNAPRVHARCVRSMVRKAISCAGR